MDEIQLRTADMLDAGQAALVQLSQLAVAYSFSILGAFILLIVGYVIAGILERSVYAGLGQFRGFDETLRKFFSKTARYALLILVGVTVLAQFGVQTASIIAALGAIGLAIGLALQGTLQNIAAGIMLLALRPFRVGEYIDAGSVAGTIEEIGLFATELKTFDGVYVLAPNSELWNTPVTNYSRNPTRRSDILVGIGYNDDIGKALSIMRDMMANDSRVLKAPEPMAFVAALADSSVNVNMRYWTSAGDFWQTQFDFTRAVKTAFEENGISIPFPQREVRYVGAPTAGDTGVEA
ncbi:mechanosensitive ion channel domain-containing protein [Mesorhizobium sp. CAU 1741]|uniref:mechanosensitive ion channel family protein n=1 Tax=Mesorhizobium sp. CAU 1741 TaxID=3140366 RepID=UPI00325BD51C